SHSGNLCAAFLVFSQTWPTPVVPGREGGCGRRRNSHLPFPVAEGGGQGAGGKKNRFVAGSPVHVLFMSCSGPVHRPCSRPVPELVLRLERAAGVHSDT